MCACLFVITNPWFYLCLMQSAFGRHAIQGQLLLLPVTCVLCVFFSCWLSQCIISTCVWYHGHCMQFNVLHVFSVPYLHLQKKPARRRYENYSMYSDDDANSDASSACSERSYSSRNGGAIPTYMRQTEDVAEVCSSSSTAEKSVNKIDIRVLWCILIYTTDCILLDT